MGPLTENSRSTSPLRSDHTRKGEKADAAAEDEAEEDEEEGAEEPADEAGARGGCAAIGGTTEAMAALWRRRRDRARADQAEREGASRSA